MGESLVGVLGRRVEWRVEGEKGAVSDEGVEQPRVGLAQSNIF